MSDPALVAQITVGRHPYRFAAAYGLLAVLAAGAVLAFAVQLRAGTHRPAHRPRATVSDCVKVGCAEVGGTASYVLTGKVTQVSTPSAGVLCVQVQNAGTRQAGDYCAYK